VDPQFIVFLCFAMVILGLPMYWVMAEARAERERVAAWHTAAARTGLRLTINGATYALAGVWRGLDVEVRQQMISRYKSSPLIAVTGRARLATDAAADAEPAQGGVRLQMVVNDGWVEYEQQSRIDPDRIEALLDALVQRARHEAAARRGA
jgi:hypothetical protein